MRYGFKRLQVLPRGEGWDVNHKRAYRPLQNLRTGALLDALRRKRSSRYR